MNEFNVIKQWYEDYLVKTSELNPYRELSINRNQVELIYQVLLKFYGLSFFDRPIIPFSNPSDQKISLETNHVIQLLMQKNKCSFLSLLDFVCLLEFSRKNFPKEFKTLIDSNKDTDALRSYLFEGFVFRMFLLNEFPLEINPTVGTQVLEAKTILNGRPTIIECKKFYLPENASSRLVKKVGNFWFRKWSQYQTDIFAFIKFPSEKKFQEPDYCSAISTFFNKTKGQLDETPYRWTKAIDGIEIDLLHLEKKKDGLFETLKEQMTGTFYFFCPYLPSTVFSKYTNVPINYGNNVILSLDEIEKKLLKLFNKAWRQHRHTHDSIKVLFIENETTAYGEIQGMFLDRLPSDFVVKNSRYDATVIIEKDLRPGSCKISKKVYAKKENQELNTILDKMDLHLWKG